MEKRFRVGIVGLSAERGWATMAHIPALRALSDVFEIAGVANTSLASAQAAAAAFDIPRAFENVVELVASPDIDVVVVTVKVPYHKEVVAAALEAGKNVYCEWPLGNGLAEATELARLANETKALAVIGTQAIASPEVQFIRKLVADGYVGEVLSSTYISAGVSWGASIPSGDVYAMDSKNGATLLSVIGGHAIAAVQSVLGPIREVDAVLSRRRQSVSTIETGESIHRLQQVHYRLRNMHRCRHQRQRLQRHRRSHPPARPPQHRRRWRIRPQPAQLPLRLQLQR